MNRAVADPNIAMVMEIATALDELREELVFVGGCAAGLLVTSIRAQLIRMTEDVDVLAEVATRAEYEAMERRFEALGFERDLSPRAPICRWIRRGVMVDLLPMRPEILGFNNRWYPMAVRTAQPMSLPDGTRIRLVTAPLFVATKLEAFKGRGREDYLRSHDLEDILTIFDGREELGEEVRQCASELRDYLAAEFSKLLATPGFVEAIPAHLPADRASQMRASSLLEKLRVVSTGFVAGPGR